MGLPPFPPGLSRSPSTGPSAPPTPSSPYRTWPCVFRFSPRWDSRSRLSLPAHPAPTTPQTYLRCSFSFFASPWLRSPSHFSYYLPPSLPLDFHRHWPLLLFFCITTLWEIMRFLRVVFFRQACGSFLDFPSPRNGNTLAPYFPYVDSQSFSNNPNEPSFFPQCLLVCATQF